MRYLSPAAVALLLLLPAAEFAHAQSRTGRATGSTSRGSSASSAGRINSSAGRATQSGRSETTRSASGIARERGAITSRGTGSTGIASRGRESSASSGRLNTGTTVYGTQRAGITSGDRGRTAVLRGTSSDNRDIGGRTGTASGITTQSGRSDRGVIDTPPLRGSAVGSSSGYDRDRFDRDRYDRDRYDRYGYDRYDRYRPYDPRTYVRRPRIYSAWPVTLIRTCPFSFGFGWGRGFACFQTHWTGGFFVPFVYSYPTAVINVHTGSTYVTPAARSSYDVVYADHSCAIVSVITPGNDGYWKTLRLPANGATTRDQLQRLISNRLAEGYPFLLTDADGVQIEVPASAQVEKVTIDPCR